MRKIFIILFVVVILGAATWWLFRRPSVPPTPSPSPVPSTPPPSVNPSIPTADYPSGTTLAIGTPQGIVTVQNPYRRMISTSGSLIFFGRGPGYALVYDRATSGFLISILDPNNTNTLQTQAEKALLDALGIGQTDACKLPLTVKTGGGLTLGSWSFCLP